MKLYCFNTPIHLNYNFFLFIISCDMAYIDHAIYVWFLLWIENAFGHSGFVRQDDICGMHNGRRLYLEQGDHGILTAKNVTLSPHAHLSSLQSHEQCNLEIVTCPSCVIVVRFHHLSLSPQCGGGVMDSPCRCDYVWLSEPPYDEVSGSPFCGHFASPSATPVYHSQTRTLVLALFYSQAHKHAFTLEYSSERNRQVIRGIPGHGTVVGGNVSAGGFINSPFFPAQYPRDLGAEYIINCQANLTLSCKVRLIFSDFQLAAVSVMEFYDWNGQRMEVTSGTSFRPSVILSSGPSLLVRFYANGGSGIGYKASYSFLSGSYDEKAVKPITDCGGFVENLGGAITMMNMVKRGSPAKMYDCIWLIRPPSSFYHLKTHLYLKVATFLDMGGSTELIVRQGLTSDGPVLETMRHPVTAVGLTRPKREHILPLNVGFYVSLRGSFSSASRLAILYAAFTYMDCYTGSDFLCQNHRCIPAQLSCDGFDHCGDNSDEPDTCTREWEMEPVDRRWYSHTPNYYFPKMERYPDLKTATLIFVISSLGLIFLIAALVVLLYRMGSRARQQRELHNRLQTISELLDGARIEEVQTDEPPVYEAPPDYEEVIKRKNTSQKRKKKNRNRSRSSPGSLQIIQAATSSRRLEVSLPQVSSSPQYRPLNPTPLSTSAISRSSQVTPVPDSPPPPYSDDLLTSQTPTLLPEESAELNEWEQRTNGTFNCSEHIEPLVSLIVTSPVPTPDLPETCQLLSVTTNSNDESQDFTTNSLISIDCNSHDDDVFYKEKELSPSITTNSFNTQQSNEIVFKRILRRPQRSRRNVYSLDVSHLTRLYDIKCQCEGACGCSTIGQIIRPLSAELKRTAATWSPSSYNLKALDICLSQMDMELHTQRQWLGSPFHVLKSVPKGSPLTLSVSASVDNLKDLV